jgi:hypothetical protein
MTELKNIEFYQDGDGELKLNVQVEDKTVWLTHGQMVDLFGKAKGTISEHISNIFEEGELIKEATVRKSRTVQKEGEREVSRIQEFYNLDVIISVGYRVKSNRGTQFRQWATKTLNEYLLKGYALNENRLKQQGQDFQHLTSLFEKSIKKYDLVSPAALEMISIIRQYASSFTLLQQYDVDDLKEPSGNRSSKPILT